MIGFIQHQKFNCPRCGAPGEVNFGQAAYSCTCRFSAYNMASNPAHDKGSLTYGKPDPNRQNQTLQENTCCSDVHPGRGCFP